MPATLRIPAIAVAAALCAHAAAQDRPMHANLSPALLPMYRDLLTGGTGDLLIIGDSLTVRPGTFTYAIDDLLWEAHGIAGDGFRGIGQGFDADMRQGISAVGGNGYWQSGASGGREPYYGPYTLEGGFIELNPGGHRTYHVFGPHVRVYYVTQPGGGAFQVISGGKPLALVGTAGELGHGFVDVDLGGSGLDVRELTVRAAPGSEGPLVVSAFEMRTGAGGYMQHYAGRGGVGPEDFLTADRATFSSIVGSIDPDAVLIMLDWSGYDEPPGFRADIESLIERVHDGAPGARIVLLTHHPFKETIATQADTYLAIAEAGGHGYVNLYDLFDGREELEALGYFDDFVHLSPEGGRYVGGYLFDLFEAYGRAGVAADQNGDAELDHTDVLAFLESFTQRRASADLAAPEGVWDYSDVTAFLVSFGLASE